MFTQRRIQDLWKGGGGGRESKFLDAVPENNKNRPKKKKKSAEKRGAAADSAPPPLDPPLFTDVTLYSVMSHKALDKHNPRDRSPGPGQTKLVVINSIYGRIISSQLQLTVWTGSI